MSTKSKYLLGFATLVSGVLIGSPAFADRPNGWSSLGNSNRGYNNGFPGNQQGWSSQNGNRGASNGATRGDMHNDQGHVDNRGAAHPNGDGDGTVHTARGGGNINADAGHGPGNDGRGYSPGRGNDGRGSVAFGGWAQGGRLGPAYPSPAYRGWGFGYGAIFAPVVIILPVYNGWGFGGSYRGYTGVGGYSRFRGY